MTKLSQEEKGILYSLCFDGVAKIKEQSKDVIDTASSKEEWDLVDIYLSQVKEAQRIMEKINPRAKRK